MKPGDIYDLSDLEVTTGCEAMHQRGGQHVAMACTGVRLYSPKIGIGVTVSSERSQHRNKAEALRLLQLLVESERERAS